MNPCRLHITGASGAGTTTLARAVATAWSVPHADADDYFWLPTTPPYVAKREPAERLGLMDQVFVGRGAWVLSGIGGLGAVLLVLSDGNTSVGDVVMFAASIVMTLAGAWLAVTGRNTLRRAPTPAGRT